jgi:translation initiation factor IF-2
MLRPVSEEVALGEAEVRALIRISRFGTIAGSYVTRGTIRRGVRARIVRDGAVVYETTIDSLKRFKDDVREVEKGFECGVGVEGFADFKNLDIIEDFEIEETRPSLF